VRSSRKRWLDALIARNLNAFLLIVLDIDVFIRMHNYIAVMNEAVAGLSRLPLPNRLLRQTHARLMQGVRGAHKQPGDYRSSQNWIGGSNLADAAFIYESRLARIELNEDEKARLDAEEEALTEDEAVTEQEKATWTSIEKLVGSEKRLALVAQDLVRHFEGRKRIIRFPATTLIQQAFSVHLLVSLLAYVLIEEVWQMRFKRSIWKFMLSEAQLLREQAEWD